MPKNVKGDPLGVFEHPLFCKIEKNEGGPFGDIKKIAKKSLTKPKKPAQKFFWSWAGFEPVFLLGRPQKILQKIRSRRSFISVALSGSQLKKLMKSVTSLVLKKENKPGTAQIGAISKAQKQQKDFKVSNILFYSTRMSPFCFVLG